MIHLPFSLGPRAAVRLRRTGGTALGLVLWALGLFLLVDAADLWFGDRGEGSLLRGALAFPFALVLLAAALAVTAWLVRRWTDAPKGGRPPAE